MRITSSASASRISVRESQSRGCVIMNPRRAASGRTALASVVETRAGHARFHCLLALLSRRRWGRALRSRAARSPRPPSSSPSTLFWHGADLAHAATTTLRRILCAHCPFYRLLPRAM
eukprot:scaffold9353_cov31-Tisochrysis_lutea.AAC.6